METIRWFCCCLYEIKLQDLGCFVCSAGYGKYAIAVLGIGGSITELDVDDGA